MPLLPFRTLSHDSGTVNPTGDTAPKPVTTTRLLLTILSQSFVEHPKTKEPRKTSGSAGV